ncbi:helicase [Vibrio cholerae]|nr:helicase [Vibrio cholerae]
MLHTEFKHFGLHNSPTLSALRAKNDLGEANLMLRLASLSERSQWILYTAQCQRPNRQSLHEHQIDCGKVIHLKASTCHSEAEIVAKAIACRTASAIVASNAIDCVTQKQLMHFAKQHGCELFFIKQTTHSLH